MSSVVISGDTSGAVTLAAPAVAGTNTLTLLAATATNSVNVLGTAVASTSGTSIDFTALPSWVKKITVMFSGVSTSGTSLIQIQAGTGATPTYTTSGYVSGGSNGNSPTVVTQTTGLNVDNIGNAAFTRTGSGTLTNLTGNTWTWSFACTTSNGPSFGAGSIALGATLTAVRITTVNGTDTFDAGTINILYEG
jgi:hypothetical protein